jgi:signal transduction histidine kinase/CheY-like chemotaxis protein
MDTTLREPGALRSRILAQVAGPEEFTERILWLYSHPEESATDVVRLLDGRVLERFTQPQRMGSTIVGRVWSYRDVTGREAALEARSHFLAGVSHEIRTPLTGMISAADLLERTPLSEDQRLLAESLKSSGRHLLVLINDLLDAARLEASSFTVDTFPFQPEELLGEVAALVRPSFEEASLRFEVRRPLRKPPSVHGDPARIRQILINLLSNARRFTSDGGVEVSLDWTLAADRLELRFCVSDSGPGIVPADRERIFEAFYQSRNTQLVNQMQGSGLGLAISRGLAERMGGRLFLDATGPSGSVFALELTLPVATQTVPPGLDADVRVRPASILLADDHDENRRLLARLIGEGGHTVREVSDGRAAIEAATTQDFDLILMDLQMPGMDGLEATRAIRARLRHHVPIIALTAHATDEFRRRCLEAGMDDHLAKPFSQFLLLRTLSKWIGSAEPDPVIADLVPGYLAARKDEIVLLEARLREKDLAAIRKIAHNLKGTGAGYGFPAFSQIGAELEAAAMEGNEDDLAGTLRRYRHALNKIEQSSSKTE